MTRGPLLAAILSVCLLMLASCSNDKHPEGGTDTASDKSGTSEQPANGNVLRVRLGANGKDCTRSDPCGSVADAWAKAKPGDVIELEPGDYKDGITIGPTDGPPTDGGIEVRGTDRGRVMINNIVIRAHHVKMHDLTIVTTLRTLPSSGVDHIDGFELRDSTIKGGTVFMNGIRQAVIADNEFIDGQNQDALDLKDDSDGVEITGNVFRDYRWDPDAANSDLHVDCIQLFGSRNVTISSNHFSNCAQRAIIVQVAAGNAFGTSAITIENNLIGGCDAGSKCQNRDVPFQATGPIASAGQTEKGQSGPKPASDYKIVNNLIEGFAYVEKMPGLIFANNIFQRYFNEYPQGLACGADGVGHNLVADQGTCPSLSAGDRLGTVQFRNDPYLSSSFDVVDQAALGFADPDVAPPKDIKGRAACGARDVGPYELGC